MKKIFVILLGISFVGAFFTTSTFAANSTARFRGSTRYYQSMDAFSQSSKQTTGLYRYSSRRLRTTTNWNLLQQKSADSRTVPTTQRRVSTRSRFSTSKAPLIQSQRNMKDEYTSFKAQNIAFSISLPEEFEIVSDTLTWENGEFIFQNGNARIKLMATKDRCDKGVDYCLRAKSDAALKTFQETLPKMVMRKNKTISLDSNQAQIKKENMGWFVDLYARDYGAGQLTFFDPINEFVWILSITDPYHSTGLLKNDRDLSKIFASLMQKSVISSKTSRTSLSNIFGIRNRSTGKNTQNKSSLAYGNSSVKEFVAEKVPFHISLPNGFELVSDTIERSMGVMSFAKELETVTVTAMEDLCDDQTPRLIRRCIDGHAAVLKKELQMEFPDARILQDENAQVQLVDVYNSGQNSRQTSSVKEHIGKIVVLREKGKRMGYFVFAEPEIGHVWKVRMEAPENKEAFLSDVRQKTKIINSLFFEIEK